MSTDLNLSRRAMLAGAAAMPAVALAPTLTSAAAEPDPVFAAIEKHRRIYAEMDATSLRLAEIQDELMVQRWQSQGSNEGHRPYGVIAWRNYSAVSGSEIDQVREEFIRDAVADVETIEREYREKRSEYRAQLRAGREWDRKHGLASLCTRDHKLTRAEFAAREELSKIRPTTIAGATALIEYLHADMKEFKNCEDWHEGALVNVVTALKAVAA